jgi:hypothetical protein
MGEWLNQRRAKAPRPDGRGGSSPSLSAICGSSSMVELQPSKLKTRGSIPPTRSKNCSLRLAARIADLHSEDRGFESRRERHCRDRVAAIALAFEAMVGLSAAQVRVLLPVPICVPSPSVGVRQRLASGPASLLVQAVDRRSLAEHPSIRSARLLRFNLSPV